MSSAVSYPSYDKDGADKHVTYPATVLSAKKRSPDSGNISGDKMSFYSHDGRSPTSKSPPYSEFSDTKSYPAKESYKYSDSFDSDSETQSRYREPASKGTAKDKGTKYSKKSYKSSATSYSTYYTPSPRFVGKRGRKSTSQKKYWDLHVPNKKPWQQSSGLPKKRGGGVKKSPRSISVDDSPRKSNVVAKRMLSANVHRINGLQNEVNDLAKVCDELSIENKLLKRMQHRSEKALSRFEAEENELPVLLKKHNAEVNSLKQRLRKYKDENMRKDKLLKDRDHELLKTQDSLKKFKRIAGEKGLPERYELSRKLGEKENALLEMERKYTDLEKYLENLKKNHRAEVHDLHSQIREHKSELLKTQKDYEQNKEILKEKEKERDIANIYSYRLNRDTPSGTPVIPKKSHARMVHRATMTDSVTADASSPGKGPTALNHPKPAAARPAARHGDAATKAAESVRKSKEESPRREEPKPPPPTKVTADEEIHGEVRDTTNPSLPAGPKLNSGEAEARQSHKGSGQILKPQPPNKKDVSEDDKILQELDMGIQWRSSSSEVITTKHSDSNQPKAEESVHQTEEREKQFKEESRRKKPVVENKEKDFLFQIEDQNRKEPDLSGNESPGLYFGSKQKNRDSPVTANFRDLQRYRQNSSGTSRKNTVGNTNSGANPIFGHHNDDFSQNRNSTNDGSKVEAASSPPPAESPRMYTFSKPVENLHNGKPSHPEVLTSVQKKEKLAKNVDDDDLEFGSYAPSFLTSRSTSQKSSQPAATNKKKNLMSDLFGDSSSKNPDSKVSSSLQGDDIFTLSTRAKPISDKKSTLPWERSKDTPNYSSNNIFQSKSNSSPNEIEEDIEEFVL